MKIADAEQVQEAIRDYYTDADLWLPTMMNSDDVDSHRIYRLEVLKNDGTTKFYRLRDRINNEETLRKHLIKHTPINCYFSVSSWLNPTKTSYKTYAKDWDGREHRDKNGFLYSDFVVDCDHKDREEVELIYKYMLDQGIPEDKLQLRFSGAGWHVIVKQWYRNKDIVDPIEREKHAYQQMQKFSKKMIDKGFEFDYIIQNDAVNSPSADTRRVTKLPNTFTKYGNKSEIVEFENLYNFVPIQIYDGIQVLSKKNNLQEHRNRDNWVIKLG